MWRPLIKYGLSGKPVLLLAIISFNTLVYSQEHDPGDSVRFMPPRIITHLPEARIYFYGKRINTVSDSVIPASLPVDLRSIIFYDSLETKASKYLITKKLYELIVSPGHTSASRILTPAIQNGFSEYKGKIIRNISIKRLDVFGTDINNPLVYNPGITEEFLNKTHINTSELIIRNNLLFTSGDTLSPLVLSDNERILRELPFIDDSRIIVIPVSEESVDILVLSKDLYSIGINAELRSLKKGSLSLFDKNLMGIGHEFRLNVPFDPEMPDSPGLGIEYTINNIRRSFINLDLFFNQGLGTKGYGFNLERRLISSTTKYAGGISVKQMFTSIDMKRQTALEPFNYNFQDYWISRSFLVDMESVKRVILGARYTFNNVSEHPSIDPDSFHDLQKYKMLLGSISYSRQKYFKTNLIYGHGRTEDIPYGGLLTLTLGHEINGESGDRNYAGIMASAGHTIAPLGYFLTSGGASTFVSSQNTEQGMVFIRTNFFSNLLSLGTFRMRNFVVVDYTRGFGRWPDEVLAFRHDNGFSGFRNDSVGGAQRLSVGIESVLFSPVNLYGFRFAFFGYADIAYLFGTNEFVYQGEMLSSIGLGIRIRNDNLVFNTFQIRLGFFPNLPVNSSVSNLTVSGEQLLKPDNFDPGPPMVLPYR